MRCARCGAANPDGQRFCGDCGAHRIDELRVAPPPRSAGVPPSILLNAFLKSASTYISDMLVAGLGARRSFVTVGIFPGDLILFDRIQAFARGGQVAQQHFPASPENLAYLRKFEIPIVLHVRDPRAVMVSWTHHLASAAGGLDELFWYYPSICPPPGFLARPFGWRLSWCLEQHLPHFVAWLDAWCGAADRGDARALFTTFEAFVDDRPEFFHAILRHVGIAASAFRDPAAAPGPQHLFRRGRVDEWRSVMDTQQARAALAAIPPRLALRFGWQP